MRTRTDTEKNIFFFFLAIYDFKTGLAEQGKKCQRGICLSRHLDIVREK